MKKPKLFMLIGKGKVHVDAWREVTQNGYSVEVQLRVNSKGMSEASAVY